jgi:MFS family permease
MNLQTTIADRTDRVYRIIFDETEEARVCTGIPEEACHDVPGNFFKIGAAQTATKVADELANAKTVLPWLLTAIGAAPLWIGLLVPVRESMSMLPQIVIADLVRRQPRRQTVWLWGAILQSATLVLMAIVAVSLRGPWTGPAVVGLLLLFSLARGLCSIASKDVIGKTIPKRRRGRLTGLTAAVSGALTIGLGLALVAFRSPDTPPSLFAIFFAAGAGLWLVAAGIYRTVAETPGATEGGRRAVREAFKRLSILRTDFAFRRFVIVRALLVATALAAPYYVIIARESGGGVELIGFFVLASALASALSSFIWGWFADRSSRMVLIVAAAIASALGIVVFILDTLSSGQNSLGWIATAGFFILAIAHSGVRIARKTYILDLAGGDKRTDYVAVSNTLIGAVLLISGIFGVLTPILGAAGMLLFLSILGATGVFLGLRLPEA